MNMNTHVGESDLLFSNTINMIGFSNHSNDGDLIVPTQIGSRGSGTGSPSSLDGADAAGNGATNFSMEDASKSFPIILHTIVSDVNSDNCIQWLPCGTRFVIADKDDFSTIILPRYFGGRGGSTTKFTSFTRRLKRWKFSRVPSGREMGAYYHEKFRRGEPELAKKIQYPVTKSQAVASKGGSGGAGGGNKKPPAIPKARRRASTGSIAVLSKKNKLGVSEQDDPTSIVGLMDISPTPIKGGPIEVIENGNILPLPVLENDMSDWLSSADFMDSIGKPPSSSMNNIDEQGAPSIDAEVEPAPSVVSSSSSFLLPPPAFPNSVMSGGSLGSANEAMNNMMPLPHNPMMMRPGGGGGMMRRHSTYLENLTTAPSAAASLSMPMMMTSTSYGSSSATSNNRVFHNSSQLLGTNFSCVPEADSSTNVMPTQMTADNHSSSSGCGEFKDPFGSFHREFSFDDLKDRKSVV